MYSVIDIESNGAAFRKENIIEIAIYRYDGHEIVDQFISLVNPQSEITPFVQKLTKITPKMVKTAPKFHEIAKRVVEITSSTTLVGHNIEFDYRMLRQEFKRLGYDFKINTLDTIPLAKKLIPEEPSYSLGKLVKSLGIPLTEHHRAGGDARATLDLFKLLIIKDKDSEIIQSQHEETNAKTYLTSAHSYTRWTSSNTRLLLPNLLISPTATTSPQTFKRASILLLQPWSFAMAIRTMHSCGSARFHIYSKISIRCYS